MAKFVSELPESSPMQMLALAVAVNAALRGETTNTGVLEVADGQTEERYRMPVAVRGVWPCSSPWMRRLRQWTGGWRT